MSATKLFQVGISLKVGLTFPSLKYALTLMFWFHFPTICVPSATRHNMLDFSETEPISRIAAQHSYVPLLSIRHDSPSKIIPDFLCATLELSRQSDGRSNPEVVGSIPTKVKRFFLCLVWFPVSLY